MSPSASPGEGIAPLVPAPLVPGPPVRSAAHGRRGVVGARSSAVAPRRRDLEVLATVIVGMAALLTGPLIWPAAGLLLAAMVVGTLQVLAGDDEDGSAGRGGLGDRGVPIESLILPAIAAIGCLGAIRLVPVGLALVPALAAVAILIDRAIAVETRLVAEERAPTDDDRSRTMIALLTVALVAFVGVAAAVPGGIAGLEPVGAPVAPLALGNLLVLALGDAFVAALLGYRAAALRATNLRDALWSALTYGVAIAIGAAAIRALGIPRLIGPALLMLLFYLWDVVHGAAPASRRDARWIWQTAVLAGLGIVVAWWNLRLVG
ncbi:MAG TPA: hypothetical protein VNM34_14470 [Verrucomicrobiae bacterium]|nr:hypothetical protein [Verrucomicrobiae bacterium]